MIAGLIGLGACANIQPDPITRATRMIPTLIPTAKTTTPPKEATATLEPSDSGWIAGESGLALRRMRADAGAGHPNSQIIIARIDPTMVWLRVAYAPDKPRALRTWFVGEQALLVVNGGYFTEHYRSTGLVISDGKASGTSYEGFGGMIAVMADGNVTIQPLRDQPYDPAAPIIQATQSFPMLLFPGREPANFEDNGQRARRTAAAIDRSGRLLLIICPGSDFTLSGLANWLLISDLEIDRALNLDGGTSTGLFLKAGSLNEQIDSFSPLPIVLLAEPRG